MPSQLHEMLLLLFRNRPALAPELLREVLKVDLPEYSEVRIECSELTDVIPAEYRADLVVLLVDGRPVLGIVIEVQLSRERRKRYSWPVYVAGLRARLECPCCLLVITPSTRVARWAAKPIPLGPASQLQPLVIAPKGVPVVTDVERAKQDPELAVLSAMAHGHGDVQTAVRIALTAAAATMALDEDRRVLYCDLIEAALGQAARKAFAMLPESYKFQSPTFKKGMREGKLEGKLEGKAEGQRAMAAAAVFDVLEARKLAIGEPARERVSACKDLEQLRRWLRRAAVVTSAEQLFEQSE